MARCVNEKLKVMVLRLDRDIDVHDMERICEVVDTYRDRGFSFSILDLGGVHHVNGVGLRRLSETAVQLRASGGELAISGMSGSLKHIFEAVGVYNDFEYVVSSTRAIEAIKQKRGARDLDLAVIRGRGLHGIH